MLDWSDRMVQMTSVARVLSRIGPNLFASRPGLFWAAGVMTRANYPAGLIAGIHPPRLSTMRIWAGFPFPSSRGLKQPVELHLPLPGPLGA